MIPELDLARLVARDTVALAGLDHVLRVSGFMTLANTGLSAGDVTRAIDAYRAFFLLPENAKRSVDMARTGSNRGWGAPKSEQVDPTANPDYKEVFDIGYELPGGHPLAALGLSVYAPNLWPEQPPGFRAAIKIYAGQARGVAMDLLRAIAYVLYGDTEAFDTAFDAPMALLRGNYYPTRPEWAGAADFGIAPHTDYGCLTLLASDGQPGLEVQRADGGWEPVRAAPGTFIINFGEMLEFWSGGAVRATMHRVIGTSDERISIPLFFNPAHDTNVAPPGSGREISAGDHLARRYNETYMHLRKA